MPEWRALQAVAGKSKRFELHGAKGRILTVDCKQAMTLDELQALLSPKPSPGIDKELAEWLSQ